MAGEKASDILVKLVKGVVKRLLAEKLRGWCAEKRLLDETN
jgi:hypothetical protein